MSEQHPSGPYLPPRPGPDEPYYEPVPGGHRDLPYAGIAPYPTEPLAPVVFPPYALTPPLSQWPSPPPDPMPAPGTEYVQFFRTGRNRWWKGALAIVLLTVGYLLISLGVSLAAITLDLATGRIDEESLLQGRLVITPAVLLAVNLSAATLIPLSMLLQWWLWGQPVRWMHSVRGHVRWGLLGRVALIIVPLFVIYVGLSIFVFPQPPGGAFTAESVGLLTVVLLTTPLQAAGEEYGSRGLIARAAGSWFAAPRLALIIGTVVSAAIFMLAHGVADPWLIAYYFAFGVAMSVVVWRTGGLEAAVLIHTANNVLLFLVVIIAGQDLTAALDRGSGVGGSFVIMAMVVLVIIVALVWWWAKRTGVSRAYQPALGPTIAENAGGSREPAPVRVWSP